MIVQPVLVWDDGENLSPGPQTQPQQVALSELVTLPAQILAGLPDVEAQMQAEPTT